MILVHWSPLLKKNFVKWPTIWLSWHRRWNIKWGRRSFIWEEASSYEEVSPSSNHNEVIFSKLDKFHKMIACLSKSLQNQKIRLMCSKRSFKPSRKKALHPPLIRIKNKALLKLKNLGGKMHSWSCKWLSWRKA